MPIPVIVSAAVEGQVDEAVVRKLIQCAGGQPGTVYGKNGKDSLRRKIAGFNKAARHRPWVVLVDLDREEDCAPPLRQAWLSVPEDYLCFRIAVRQVESWLIADPETLASFLRVRGSQVPSDPESLGNAKEAMVNLARSSRGSAIREDMVPREGSGRSVGPAYTSRLVEYVSSAWRPEVAAQRADSLHRAIACVERLIEAVATRLPASTPH